MEFKVNDMVVYPGHGVAKVKRLDTKLMAGIKTPFLVLEVLATNMTLVVPVKQVGEIGIRAILSKNEAKKVLRHIQDFKPSTDTSTWNRRYREHMDKLRSGCAFDVAEVYKSLIVKKTDLSFGERKMLDFAKELLLSEVSISLDLGEMEALSLLGLSA